MKFRILFAVALLGLVNTAGAVRVLEQAERSAELTLNQLTLPAGSDGTLTFKMCTDCRTDRHRVTAGTKYVLDGHEVTLEDFLLATEEIRKSHVANETTTATVFLDLATELVTRVSVRRSAP
jgi:hypothetical protein